jgi:hypothetical protein
LRAEPLLFLTSSSSVILTRVEWTPFQTHCYSENLVALGIEPWTSELAARNSDHYITEAIAKYMILIRQAGIRVMLVTVLTAVRNKQ